MALLGEQPQREERQEPRIRLVSSTLVPATPPTSETAKVSGRANGTRWRAGVARRQTNSAARNHIGQCGSIHSVSNDSPPTWVRKSGEQPLEDQVGQEHRRDEPAQVPAAVGEVRERYPVTITNAGMCQRYIQS